MEVRKEIEYYDELLHPWKIPEEDNVNEELDVM
jgi:hypothetical protein